MESSNTLFTVNNNSHKHVISLGSGNILILIAVCVDFFTPILIWKGIIPANLRWISHAAVLIMMIGCIFRMIAKDSIPPVFLWMIAFSILWVSVAIYQEQGLLTTIWGWWLFFQFPFIGLFTYLSPNLPEKFPETFRKIVILMLVFEVAIQIIQYLSGEAIGDNLAGSFGKNGTGNLIIFLIFIDCMYLGYWITSKKWIALVFVLSLSMLSSILGELKLFPFAILAIGFLAAIIFAFKYHTLFKLVKYFVVIGVILVSFFYLYNNVVMKGKNNTLQQLITNPQKLIGYLNSTTRSYEDGFHFTDIRRNAALRIGWSSLQKDHFTLLFGWGLGSRSESKSLNITGVGLSSGNLGLSVGTSLLVMMQELGILGLLFLGIFFIWVILKLFQGIRDHPDSNITEFRYGLLLFTIFWPVWLWYNTAWTLRVPMLLYWFSLGYVLSKNNSR
jgi:hypothetical protein